MIKKTLLCGCEFENEHSNVISKHCEKHQQNDTMKMTIQELEKDRMEWALATFPEATAISSLRKLESEIKEIEHNIENGIKDPMEYADAVMCLFDSAGRNGISVDEIIDAFEQKNVINKSRKWKKNDDNSYSHIKNKCEGCGTTNPETVWIHEKWCEECEHKTFN